MGPSDSIIWPEVNDGRLRPLRTQACVKQSCMVANQHAPSPSMELDVASNRTFPMEIINQRRDFCSFPRSGPPDANSYPYRRTAALDTDVQIEGMSQPAPMTYVCFWYLTALKIPSILSEAHRAFEKIRSSLRNHAHTWKNDSSSASRYLLS